MAGDVLPVAMFFTDISVSVAQIKKNKKTKSIFFYFASGRTLPTQTTGPQPIQLIPKHCFLLLLPKVFYQSVFSQSIFSQSIFYQSVYPQS